MVRFFGFSNIIQNSNKQLKKNLFWIHAVSLGEVQGVTPLLEKLHERDPDCMIFLTVTTKTAWDYMQQYLNTVNSLNAQKFRMEILPFDFPWATERFCKNLKPSVLALMETEIWPNLIRSCKINKTRVILVNGRLSPSSFRAYKIGKRFFRRILNEIDVIVAQSDKDSARFQELGFEREVPVLSNLKFDVRPKKHHLHNGAALRSRLAKKTIWLALSTREGEEKEISTLWKQRMFSEKDQVLIIVPRHPERFYKVLNEVKIAGCIADTKTNFLRKESVHLKECPSILIGDSIGEVQMYLAASDIVLIGGSVIRKGGQNPLEACIQKKLIFFGNYMFNFEKISNDLIKERGAVLIKTYNEWFSEGQKILNDKNKSNSLRDNAFDFIVRRGGSSEKYADIIVNDWQRFNSNR
ncbi:hypothetical protein N9V13_01475 [Betaproteobacteria bacterium]|nr:hypothetical protein [Betaproteobacteria bacterium]